MENKTGRKYGEKKRTQIETICEVVCKEFGVTYSDMMSNRKWQDVADARHVARMLSEKIVGRDETLAHFESHYDTLRHSKRVTKRLTETYPAFRTKVEACQKQLQEAL